jgi:hypothetical protein
MLLIECIERGTVDVMHGWRGGGGGAAHRGRARARRPGGGPPAGRCPEGQQHTVRRGLG